MINPTAQTSPKVGPKPIDCPRGLEYLLTVDQLLIKQKVELLETLTSFETNNQYDVTNSLGQKIFLASENTDCCTRNCCGARRAFEMRIIDHSQREVIHLHRPFRCCGFCCCCCLQIIEIEAPPGVLIGRVAEDWSCWTPKYHIEDAKGNAILKIEGPCCTTSVLCQDIDFDIFAIGQSVKVGRITKQWSGILREAFTDADFYGVVFPMDLDVKVKACLLGATFLIDYMYYERSPEKQKRSIGGRTTLPGVHPMMHT